jgi:hypothetical protein
MRLESKRIRGASLTGDRLSNRRSRNPKPSSSNEWEKLSAMKDALHLCMRFALADLFALTSRSAGAAAGSSRSLPASRNPRASLGLRCGAPAFPSERGRFRRQNEGGGPPSPAGRAQSAIIDPASSCPNGFGADIMASYTHYARGGGADSVARRQYAVRRRDHIALGHPIRHFPSFRAAAQEALWRDPLPDGQRERRGAGTVRRAAPDPGDSHPQVSAQRGIGLSSESHEYAAATRASISWIIGKPLSLLVMITTP